MKTILYGLCIATLMAAAPAPAVTSVEGAQASGSPAAAASASAKDKAKAADAKICKQLPSTGSRLPQRACLTAKEWAQVEADTQ
jgi:hypothetical protein